MSDEQIAEQVREINLLIGRAQVLINRLETSLVPSTSLPPWFAFAQGELRAGVREAPGEADNPRVVWYHSFSRGGASPDSVAWCASFVNAALESSGIESTKSKAARSYAGFGIPLQSPARGCIVVFERPPNPASGHVGFYDHEDDESIHVLGGNQNNRVSIKPYPKDRLVGYRWPREYALPPGVNS